MRVLSVSQLLMPDTTGGTGRVARTLSDALIEHGVQVVALTQRLSTAAPIHERTDHLEIYRYGSPHLRTLLGMSASTALGIPAPLCRLLRRQRFDAAIGHQPVSSLMAARALRNLGVPELRFFHASGAQETMRRFAPTGPTHLRRIAEHRVVLDLRLSRLLAMEREYVRSARHLCFLSRYSREWATRLHGPNLPPSSIIPAGVDAAFFTPATDRHALRRRLLSPHEQAPILFSARNLAPRMGLDTLLHAVPALLRYNASLQLVIAGDGPMRAQLDQLASRLGIAGAVTFLGRIPDEHLVQWYQASDLFILPTAAMEGFGMVTVEAMACGTPVVGTPVGATPELLEGLHPYLLAPGVTADDLAAAITRVLMHCDLALLRAQVRAHAVQRYCIRDQADRVVRLLQQLIQEPLSPRGRSR